MREKYIDEKVGVWCIFGTHPDGTVDVNDGAVDVFCKIPKEQAEELVNAQALFRETLYVILENN